MLYYEKTRKVKSPSMAYKGDAGIDLYVPSDLKDGDIEVVDGMAYVDPAGNIMIGSLARIKIPLGIKVDFSDHESTCLLIVDKSGVATKNGLVELAKLIDVGYTGELFFSCVNLTGFTICVKPDSKLTQVLHLPFIVADMQEVDKISRSTERGGGCLGSSNTL